VPATGTVYRGHRRTLFFLPGIIFLFIMCIGIIRNNSLVGGHARAESNPGYWVCHALLHMAAECVNHSATEASVFDVYSLMNFQSSIAALWSYVYAVISRAIDVSAAEYRWNDTADRPPTSGVATWRLTRSYDLAVKLMPWLSPWLELCELSFKLVKF